MASNYIGGGVATPVTESTKPHTAVSEAPAPIQALQPPASNSGSDDPSGGIAKDAGGLSSTAGIGSPVAEENKTVVGAVLESVFGKKERTAEEVEAVAPTTSTVTTSTQPTSTTENNSGTYLGAIAAAGGAAVASIIPGMASSHGAEPHAATSSSTAVEPPVGTTSSTAAESHVGTSSWTAAEPTTATTSSTTATEPVGATTTPADVKSVSAATQDKDLTGTTQDKTLGEKAAETTESAKVAASETAQSAKETVTGEKKDEGEKDPEAEAKAKKVSDHEAAVRENKDAIPTAGGEKLGTAHAGESKVIPAVPKVEEDSQISSAAGQPDSTTADNTAKNAGEHHKGLPILGKKHDDEASSDKPKFMDRLKTKLHIGDKKDKA